MNSRPFAILGCALLLAAALWFARSPKKRPDYPFAAAVSGSVTSAPTTPDATTAAVAPPAATPAVTPDVPPPAPPPVTPAEAPPNSLPPSPPPPPPTAASLPPAGPVEPSAAAVDLDKVNLMFRDYRTLMGENPVGTNAEIMRAVMGGNPKKAVLGPPEGLSLNARGELLDQWGTPFFFHQMSKTHMEIWSAGPDKIMGTSDDVILK